MRDDGARHELSTPRGILSQWTGLIAPPMALLTQILLGLWLTSWACDRNTTSVLHATNAVTLALILAFGALAYRVWRGAGEREPGEAAGAEPRARFLGMMGVMIAALCAATVLASWIPIFLLHPCMRSG